MSDLELEVLYNYIKVYTNNIPTRDLMNRLLTKIKQNGYDVYSVPENKLKEYFKNLQ